ncbi:HAD-superfamily hydrolase, subfamily IA, variant 1 [Paenibacillus vortex V453]|uniref:HAD-superfamily hydrolase, subfamily IA, variant 1 n=1 Tax=Paenibacillus vortex V453 TaxID=715225 RepID=A0A2R9T2A5_9BACL|nr:MULTISPECIES: HAD family hydrolase [Paenibacillus]AWP30546.1 HAD family hydrolase [Paenibacillus sp. Cedars]EFU43674.1 HAD-superfamily hydrolase, subfamily IA, variant 1 [Paenibacillus vortex V453]
MNMKRTTSPKGIFFDVDDTLYDHLAPFREAVQETARPGEAFPYEAAYHRMRYYSDRLSVELGGAGTAAYGEAVEEMRRRRFQLALAEFGIPLSLEAAEVVQQTYLDRQYTIRMFAGARELLKKLADAGHVVGLITNGPADHQMNKIAAMQLGDLIPPDRLFVSGAVGWDKPDPRIFRHVNQLTGTAPESSYYIGDSWRNDVIGALAAGWNIIWFNHRSVAPESEHEPHHIVTSYGELERLLDELIG